ncbi:DUF3558 domain-containing protein [Nocardia cyriacigeorgica]|uniref:DUF3558 domain-containing protein n=1 Tax=Nocardia cyriacigeorgica TaxID=135487 RepID=UPI001893303A|nr:DUF3558 domain-containing protein [Nocardia cyriacigeorgica]MBF6397701.1 DUF3558 domain-containing protein [Nocardia cyriacigeorgica]MBF6402641.1 DUF3558 domain-containing protein [Nocardia cyriacigeorgica]
MRRIAVVVAAGALTVGVAACGETTDGTPSAQEETSSQTTVQFNPCEDLSEDVLSSVGLDPTSENTSINPPTGDTQWRICDWRAVDSPVAVGVAASTLAQDALASNPAVTGFEDVTINGREGMTYVPADDKNQLRCYVSIPAERDGMYNVIVDWPYSKRDQATEKPPCATAIRYAEALEPHLPK